MKTTTLLRRMIEGSGIHVAPGAFDGLTTRLIEQNGFDLVYASGGAIARSAGVPDIGLLSFTEVTTRPTEMAEVTSLPIIADADTGFGNEVNAVRTIATYERIGMPACTSKIRPSRNGAVTWTTRPLSPSTR